jgi:hypothetical protein
MLLPTKRRIERLILDLRMSGVSLRRIRELLRVHWYVDVPEIYMQQLFKNVAKIAKSIHLRFLDSLTKKISLAFDEIYQGMKGYALLAVSTKTRVIIDLKYSRRKTACAISQFLQGIKNLGFKPPTIITDLYSAYVKPIAKIFAGAIHILDSVHAKRRINKLITPAKKEVTAYNNEIKIITKKLEKLKKVGRNDRRGLLLKQLKNLKKQLKEAQTNYLILCEIKDNLYKALNSGDAEDARKIFQEVKLNWIVLKILLVKN